MFTIQCTKKLEAEIKDPLFNKIQSQSPPLYTWLAHLFTSNRRKCVLLMNNQTRYNFILYGLKKDDFRRFDHVIYEKIVENLTEDGIGQSLIEEYLKNYKQVIYTKTSDRSILGQINEMIFVAKDEIERNISEMGDPAIDQVNRLLNRFIILKLPKLYTIEAMHEALQDL